MPWDRRTSRVAVPSRGLLAVDRCSRRAGRSSGAPWPSRRRRTRRPRACGRRRARRDPPHGRRTAPVSSRSGRTRRCAARRPRGRCATARCPCASNARTTPTPSSSSAAGATRSLHADSSGAPPETRRDRFRSPSSGGAPFPALLPARARLSLRQTRIPHRCTVPTSHGCSASRDPRHGYPSSRVRYCLSGSGKSAWRSLTNAASIAVASVGPTPL